ncbi:MAG: ACT domain-containing protein [archaeon]|jgi:GTP pyrophosphokinase
MGFEETTQKEIQTALNYLREKTGKNNFERNKRVAEELLLKKMPRESCLAVILQEIAAEKLNEKAIEEKFGKETLKLVKVLQQIEGVVERNFGKIPSETLSSIILTISPEFEPIIVKIAEVSDALFNKEKIIYEKDYAQKADQIYYPLATKLGLTDFAWKIQDFSFRVINPQGFEKIKQLINKTRIEREKLVDEVQKEIEELLKGKLEVQVSGRPKNFKAIFDKLKKTPFVKMYDIYGIRIICNKEKECYEALGFIHSKYEIIPESFDDYITKPKTSGYKSIHTAVRRGKDIVEVQIRTWEQHLRIEGETYWQYKNVKKDKEFEKELSWERQLIEWQKSIGKDGRLGKKTVGKRIFVFTPKNDAISLPIGASIIDFAYAVHTDIGKRMEKAKINGIFVPIETKLNNLDKVEIITSDKVQAKKTWLNFVETEKAKTKIKSLFGLKTTKKKKICIAQKDLKKIKMAECCHPLPGEETIGVKTTKRKIILHKKNCPNVAKVAKDKLICIDFEQDKGKTQLKVIVLDRLGVLAEILSEVKNAGVNLTNTSFKIKKSGYAEAIFEVEVNSVEKLDKLIEKIEHIPSVQHVERI